ncbi:antitoxin MazE family protein [Spiribacter salinus]|uniref:antitoxin MazE family protein n=1 Tax=Spiribacter salinus TaxID=1335746 RepID=UPI001C9655FE|nr:antitoxin MazE family protein [Spiribacter salinus]MBY5268280.1 hypothetical protein [Spiribacter salinus]
MERDKKNAMRKAGMRLVQIWVPDTRSTSFGKEAARQAALVASADRGDAVLGSFLDTALADLEDSHASGDE